ncbi:MAG: zinc-ribbon domain-containing protein, partial [Acidobacteriota bacterium]
MYCPGCGAPAPDAARFCPRCGHALADAASAGAAGPTTAGTTPAAATDSARAGDRPLRPSPPHAGPAADDDRDAVTRPPSDRDRQPSSAGGWLTSSDSISHGRFPPGAILDGRYRVIALLGKGGMGEVYRADDLRLGQPVALKFLPDRVADDPARLAQFHN